jgi:hypothetical protein
MFLPRCSSRLAIPKPGFGYLTSMVLEQASNNRRATKASERLERPDGTVMHGGIRIGDPQCDDRQTYREVRMIQS